MPFDEATGIEACTPGADITGSVGRKAASRATGKVEAIVAETSGASLLLESAGRIAMTAAAAAAVCVATSTLVIISVARSVSAAGGGGTAGAAATRLGAPRTEELTASGLGDASGAAGGVRRVGTGRGT
jgi:hypothetical protein